MADSVVTSKRTVGFGALFVEVILTVIAFSLAAAGLAWWLKPDPIYVGVLHSQTGSMSGAELPVLRMTLAAIEDVNRHGGVNGRPIKAVVADGASTPPVFAQQAEAMLTKDKVAAIFGGLTSASRKAMLPILERDQGLLFYPAQHEGLEQSAHIFYTGLTANQQLNPGLTWMMEHFGGRVLLVGSDSIFSHAEFVSAKSLLASLGGQVCAEHYVRVGSGNAGELSALVARCRPDFIVNTVEGSDNLAVLAALRTEDDAIPLLSLTIDEVQLKQFILALGEVSTREHYVVSGYFNGLESEENNAFITSVTAMKQENIAGLLPVSAAMKAAWDGVHLWAQAANIAKTDNVAQVRATLSGMSYASATGPLSIELYNQHVWQKVYLAKAQINGQFQILWRSSALIKPTPWPIGYNKTSWNVIETGWFQQWGQQWQAP